MTGNSEAVRELVGRFYDRLWNHWDDGAVDEVLSAECQGHLPGIARTGDNRPGGLAKLPRPDANRITGLPQRGVDLVATGDRAAARLSYSGTQLGPLLGIAATGRRFSYSGAAFFTVRGDRLTAAWVLGDLDGLRIQLS